MKGKVVRWWILLGSSIREDPTKAQLSTREMLRRQWEMVDVIGHSLSISGFLPVILLSDLRISSLEKIPFR